MEDNKEELNMFIKVGVIGGFLILFSMGAAALIML
jgi:hypothetical protein